MTAVQAPDIEKAQELLRNPLWRINNLYSVIDKEGKKCQFKLNWAQEDLYRNMWYCNIILKARQLGISTLIGLLFLDRCLFNDNCSAGIICHTREDSESFFRRVKFAYDNLPEEIKALRPANNDTKNELSFNNGSSIRVGMMMRGSTLQYLHISEFGKISAKYPEKAREIITGSLNALAPGQYVFIESTAEGRDNVFADMCKKAQDLKDSHKLLTKLDFKFHFYNWMGHPEYRLDAGGIVIPAEINKYLDMIEAKTRSKIDPQQRAWYTKKLESQKEDMKREFPSLPEESFESSSDGNYYSSHLTKCRQENRIIKLFHDPKKQVHTAWDLGYADATAIWLFQIDGQRINILDYYENSGEALPHYIQWLKAKPYVLGRHLVPHDAGQTEFSSGVTRTAIAKSLGINFTQVPSVKVIEGIDAVRNILHRCYFDEEKCAKGISMLDAYRKDWNDSLGTWRDRPRHDFTSHGADAFRMLACGLSLTSDRGSVESDLKAVNAYYSR
jgi:hypothetical protein